MHTKKNLKNLKFLEVTGELLTQEMKTTLCGLFNVPVFNLYGIEEVGAIAYDDGLGNLEILEGNCILEILNDENMRCESEIEGNIIVTGLVNHVMPFVRYKTGDRGKFFIQNDKKYLIVLKARSNDSILLNGIEYDGSIFFNLVEFLNTNGKNINSFQFILKRGVLTCNFPDIKEKDLAFLIKNYFKENFSYEFQDIVISNEVLEIKKNSSKIKYFINQNI